MQTQDVNGIFTHDTSQLFRVCERLLCSYYISLYTIPLSLVRVSRQWRKEWIIRSRLALSDKTSTQT